jgi:Protein of unknown function DUF115
MSNPTTRASAAARLSVVRRALERTIVDSHLQPRAWGPVPLRTATWWSLKHRAAARRLYLTSNERRLAALRDKHRGERCFILGNGPSLNACDLTKLAGECTFGVNSIFLKTAEMGFAPTYYVCEDILVAEDRAREIDAFKGPTKFFGNYLRRFLSPGPDVLWTNVRVHYANYENFPHFATDAVRQLWVGGTVSYLCLQLAYHMGFAEVNLVGFDHNYTIPGDAKIDGNRIETTSTDPNHFHPDYFGKGYRWHNPRVDRMEVAYVRAKEVFERAGRRVQNATVGGKLEVFDRVNYDALFSSDRPLPRPAVRSAA